MKELADITISRRGGAVVVAIAGELDQSNADNVLTALDGDLPNGHPLVVDLAGLEFVASAGIRVLLSLRETPAGRAGLVRVVVPPDAPIMRVLELVDIPNLIPLDASLAGALASLAARNGDTA